jgi:hypothetical protein
MFKFELFAAQVFQWHRNVTDMAVPTFGGKFSRKLGML